MSLSKANNRARIYVGNLPIDVRERDLESLFQKYGRILMVDVKNRKGPPAFAFVEFEDLRDAEDAVRGRDGYDFDGSRLRVEFPRGVGPRGAGGRPIYGDDDRDRSRARESMRRGGYRVLVSGLPRSGSWQDLKDHFRPIGGDMCHADVNRDGTGFVEFSREDDAQRAVRKLDDTKFRSHEGDTAYVRLKFDAHYGGGGDRSRSRSRSRSPRGYDSGDRSRGRSRYCHLCAENDAEL